MRSIRWTKQTVNIPLRQLAHSMEAVWAFAQKRRPNFTGR
jgi:hypothetical protein